MVRTAPQRMVVAMLTLVAVGGTLVQGASAAVIRTSRITTDNCDDAADPNAGAPAGLCQASGNATQPGGDNPDVISAKMTLIDNGATLVGIGTGKGFRPGGVYVSLVYLNPTVQTCARFPVGQAALTANTANADNDFASMFLGFWSVDSRGKGTFSVYPGKTSPLGNLSTGQTGLAAYGTASVREAAGGFVNNQTQTIANNIAGGRDIPPNIFALRACGSLVQKGNGR